MPKKLEIVKDILSAIKSVRGRAQAAMDAKDFDGFAKLMGDLYALEVCLVSETEKLVAEIETPPLVEIEDMLEAA